MQAYGEQASPDGSLGTHAGLVLLYAPTYDLFDPAYLLEGADLIIGRVPESGICIPEAAVSRQHARIHYQGGRWILTDLGGRNGTLVDGEFVHEITLEHLHEIRVGDVIFKFVEADAEGYARFRIDGSIVGASPEETVAHKAHLGDIVGGHQVARIASALERVARSPVSVILLGESGTGKEVFARFIHEMSGRKGALRAINCAAIPRELLESELFGYKRGAFSGADRDKIGLIRAADGGTLMLDEIGDMPLEAQAKLLRVIQSKEVIPIGATAPERVDVRFVCATHRDLAKLQQEARFRGDLFARLNEYRVNLPPLRERKEDVFALCKAFLARHGRPDLGLSFPFMTGLLHYDFPFNVRELEGFIKRGIALTDGGALDAAHLPDEIKELMKSYAQRHAAEAPKTPPDQEAILPGPRSPRRPAAPTEQELRALLTLHKGNVAAVGREFGKERMQVHRWMKRFGINADEYR
ncbi:MAG: sigma 54-interacting transcriptional regulator [Polyangiaceae bacterium]|nr:sigma 54-interacting transcriptional regulator [Polyangiaceae bacterium]